MDIPVEMMLKLPSSLNYVYLPQAFRGAFTYSVHTWYHLIPSLTWAAPSSIDVLIYGILAWIARKVEEVAASCFRIN